MTSTLDQGFRQALQGDHLRAVPMGRDSDWETLHRHAHDPRLYDMAFGMGEVPTLTYIKQCVLETPDIRVWEAFSETRLVGYLVYSIWTNLPRVTVYLIDTPWDQALWRDGLNMLTDLFFAQDTQRNMLYAHFALPVDDETDMWVVELGFAPADQAMYIRKMERAIFGLARGIYDMFHEELDENDFAY